MALARYLESSSSLSNNKSGAGCPPIGSTLRDEKLNLIYRRLPALQSSTVKPPAALNLVAGELALFGQRREKMPLQHEVFFFRIVVGKNYRIKNIKTGINVGRRRIRRLLQKIMDAVLSHYGHAVVLGFFYFYERDGRRRHMSAVEFCHVGEVKILYLVAV